MQDDPTCGGSRQADHRAVLPSDGEMRNDFPGATIEAGSGEATRINREESQLYTKHNPYAGGKTAQTALATPINPQDIPTYNYHVAKSGIAAANRWLAIREGRTP